MKNTRARYGVVTKVLHWTLFVLIVNQFVVATMMLNTPQGTTTAGFTQGVLYNWHKSIGLIALAVALARFIWRKTTPAARLGAQPERRREALAPAHRDHALLLHVPDADQRLRLRDGRRVWRDFFGQWNLPNYLGKHATVSVIANGCTASTAALLVLTLFAHWGLGIRHHLRHRDRYLHRMLPFTHQK